MTDSQIEIGYTRNPELASDDESRIRADCSGELSFDSELELHAAVIEGPHLFHLTGDDTADADLRSDRKARERLLGVRHSSD